MAYEKRFTREAIGIDRAVRERGIVLILRLYRRQPVPRCKNYTHTHFSGSAAGEFPIIVRVFEHIEVARALIYTNAVTRLPVALLVMMTTLTMTPAGVSAQVAPPISPVPGGPVATFKSGVDLVTVSVAVRDGRGRVVRDLTKADFQVIDSGIARPIKDFYFGESPISLAILL